MPHPITTRCEVNIRATIRQQAREIPRTQAIREFPKNCYEAGATKVDIAPLMIEGAEKLVFVDDGCGMNHDQLVLCGNLNMSGETGKTAENMGWGAKVSTLGWNDYISWYSMQNGVTHQLTVHFDENGDLVKTIVKLDLNVWTKGVLAPLQHLPAVKNTLKNGHGTVALLGGSAAEPDSFTSWGVQTTTNEEVKGANRTRTLITYLSSKFLQIPCPTYYYWELPTGAKGEYAARGKVHSILEMIKGGEEDGPVDDVRSWTLNSKKYGRCEVYYSPSFNERLHNKHRVAGGKGLFLTAYRNEAYGEVLEGARAAKIFKDLGLWQSKIHRNLIVIAYPVEAEGC